MNQPDPVPRDFGWRYVWWIVWTNLITILSVAQGVLAALMLDQDILSHAAFRYIVLGNAILTAIIAQVKRNTPPSPPPTKGP